jgi:cytochrome c peroxidase
MVTSKLPALQFYQLALPAPQPKAGVDFNAAAADRGDQLFSGKAKCQSCHNEPIWTEAGWSLHKASEVGIDDFQASRGPDGVLKTANLTALFVREQGYFMDPANKGRYYHDGRFKTLKEVVMHYNSFMKLNLTEQEMNDLVEYLKSI